MSVTLNVWEYTCTELLATAPCVLNGVATFFGRVLLITQPRILIRSSDNRSLIHWYPVEGFE